MNDKDRILLRGENRRLRDLLTKREAMHQLELTACAEAGKAEVDRLREQRDALVAALEELLRVSPEALGDPSPSDDARAALALAKDPTP